MKTIEDLFIIHHARSGAFAEYKPGEVAYLTNGFTDNGVVGYVKPQPADKVFKFRALVVSAFCEATVQLPPFIAYGAAGTSLNVLEPRKTMTAGQLAYIAAYINAAHRWRFNWYRRSIGSRLRALRIQEDDSGKTNFPVNTLLPAVTPRKPRSWDANFNPVALGDLFDLVPGEYHSLAKLSPGKVPVISCSDEDNGIAGYFDVTYGLHEQKLTIALNGSPLATKYHPYRFAAKDDAAVCIPKQALRISTLLFIQMALNLERWRYSYYRKCYMDKLRRFRVMLPINGKGLDENAMARIFEDAPYWGYLNNRLITCMEG